MATVTLHDEPRMFQHEAYEDNRRQWKYHQRYGKSAAAAIGRSKHQEAYMKAHLAGELKESTLADFQKALDAHSRTLTRLKNVARDLPRGADRTKAVRLAVQAGMRKSEAARLMGVSRQRVGEMLNTDEIPF